MALFLDDEEVCRGIVAQNLTTMEIESFRSDAVIMATGGPGIVFGKSTNSMINTGSAASIVYQQGAHYANGEFIQIHPTAIPGDDKLRLMSESARGEGGRVWTYKDGKPWYFLEEKNTQHTGTLYRVTLQRVKSLTYVSSKKSLASTERTWYISIFLTKIQKSLILSLAESLKSMKNSWVTTRVSCR
ncbi:hypothetical protein BsIDN1_49860 [Bacillus safensis]|uniref:FAD-dependent oxidoreductase 2 FAD-binding domain-containing protein n=1 Tax=Bacillus safensis TaxID=561879 RepID=A0A5S9MEE8_BACIA|nr:hypothetical protein BsIDN1_49860 [Bacillus safensis]